MIGGLSRLNNSVAIANRSMADAQKRASESSNRIATGSKVNSAKDNGSGYILQQNLKNETATWEYRESELKRYGAFSELVVLQHEEGITLQREAYNLLKYAALSAPNSQDRQRYYDEWQGLAARAAELGQLYTQQGEIYAHLYTDVMESGADWAYDPYDTDSFLDKLKLPDSWYLSSSITSGSTSPGYGVNVNLVNQNFMTATTAQMALAADDMMNAGGSGIARTNLNLATVGGSAKNIERAEEVSRKFQAIVSNAQSEIFDTNLEIESARLNAARVKTELATNAISLFIDNFRNKATSLLGNIMQTQASIRA